MAENHGFALDEYHRAGLAIEIESYRARVGGASEATPTVFRREDGIWKVTHRHAVPITAPRPAESVQR
jgi:hypothetical protein